MERIRRVRPRVWLGALGVIVVLGFLEILAQHPVIPIGPIVPPALTASGSTAVSASPAANGAPLVTDRIGPLTVRHPAAWHVVSGPPGVPGRTVPLFYLANVSLSVGTCPSLTPEGVAGPCAPPVRSLPPAGVLVTVQPNLGLAETIPPQVAVVPPEGTCAEISGDAEMTSVAAGAIVTACLRAPGLALEEAEVRDLVGSIRGRLTVDRFRLNSSAP